ncbi:MAG: 16S rRNA (cytidine(1402)-2'-O)-methyltransferase [Thermoflavifilum sp.]|nr:16S rRNA (cytidine(1402)-2'-O)-methyltransferase [Thermoflavifilum sp.]
MPLYIVPTPIGNLEDITLRAIRILQAVDLILAEDTRTSTILLQHYQIHKPLRAYHQHNEHAIVDQLVQQLQSGMSMALLSDAGTPGISDPGYLLVRQAITAGIVVECLPGPTAFIPALVCSGLPMHRFCFEGFLPLKKGRKTRLQELSLESRTIVLYESPHRLLKTLQELITYFGAQRLCSASREISKKFEQHIRGTLQEVYTQLSATQIRGEWVLVIAGKEKDESTT